MARLDAMATIANYLSPPPVQPHADPSDSVPNVQVAPGINAPAPLTELTANQKRAFDANRQTQQDQQKAEKDLELSRSEQLQAAMAADQAKKDAFEQQAQTTVGAVKRIGTGAGVRLASIPLPGGLTLPLVILFVFFALLIPVNGHTRLTWLWLVLTNNASIGVTTGTEQSGNVGQDQSGNTNTGGGTQTTGGGPGPIGTILSPGNGFGPVGGGTFLPFTLPIFTGAQEII